MHLTKKQELSFFLWMCIFFLHIVLSGEKNTLFLRQHMNEGVFGVNNVLSVQKKRWLNAAVW